MKAKIMILALATFLLALPIAFAENYVLQKPDSEILIDTFIQKNIPTQVNDGGITLKIRDNTTTNTNNEMVIITFNISNSSVTDTITNASFRWTVTIDEGVGAPQLFIVNDTNISTDMSWNNRPQFSQWNSNYMNTSVTGISAAGIGNKTFYGLESGLQRAISEGRKNFTILIITTSGGSLEIVANSKEATVDQSVMPMLNYTFTAGAGDTTPPTIDQNSYNMTSEGGAGCDNWRTNPTTPCSTGDTTPTVNFTTSEPAWCAIGIQSINFTQYVDLGIDRNCTIGQGTSSHTCTLTPDDELTYQDATIYISCRDSSGNENSTDKSTSGPLSLTITGLEAGTDEAIGVGVQNALLSGYTNYTNQQIYARKLDGTQDFGTFDWMAKKGGKVWAFNHVTKGEQHVGMFNLTPVLYVLEMSNNTNSTITNLVELMINATK